MNPIYKTFFGKTIDLSKIISIGEPRFLYDDYHGLCVKFEIMYQLSDKPLIAFVDTTEEEVYTNTTARDDTGFYPKMVKLINGKLKRYQDLKNDDIPAVLIRVQSQVKELIQILEHYKQSEKQPIPFSYSEKSGKCPARFQDKCGQPICRLISDHVLRGCKDESCLMIHWSKET